MNKDRASGIIIKDNKILLIHRIREDREYWVFPGGGVEENETIEQALDREIAEELSLTVKDKKFLFKIENSGRFEHHFLISEYGGKPKLGGPELERMNNKNQYILTWIPVDQLNSINLLPDKVKEIAISFFQNTKKVSNGVVHKVPDDLRKTLATDPKALKAWEDITPLAHNEWICWIESVKKPETRRQHVEGTRNEFIGEKRRPCCWAGCNHR